MATKSKLAQALGCMAKGKPKRYSADEIAKRTDRLLKGAKRHRLQERKKAGMERRLAWS